jgi:hypothetical protein
MLIQFIAAFDDIVIGRHNKNREEKEKIQVRYVHAPKERVLFDIVNKAQNITLPVVSINITSINRDETRVFSKNEYIYQKTSLSATHYLRMPVPVNLTISMSILASYQSDLDQIISNFVPYANPYVIISWKIPEAFGLPNINEIRSEVLWDGTISLEYPTDVDATNKPRFVATTSFTIKGWLFPEEPNDVYKNIYFIDANFHSTNEINKTFSYYGDLSAIGTGNTEVVSLTGKPEITNQYLLANGIKLYDILNEYIISDEDQNCSILLLGKNFLDINNVILSSDTINTDTSEINLDYTYYPSISGYTIPDTNYKILDKNTMIVTLPPISGVGEFQIVLSNIVGYAQGVDSDVSFFAFCQL